MQLKYFASVRQSLGRSQEELSKPESVSDVAGLLDWLRGLGEDYAAALDPRRAIRVAVNQDFAALDDPVGEADEIAIFPPVTGG